MSVWDDEGVALVHRLKAASLHLAALKQQGRKQTSRARAFAEAAAVDVITGEPEPGSRPLEAGEDGVTTEAGACLLSDGRVYVLPDEIADALTERLGDPLPATAPVPDEEPAAC